MNLIFEKKDGSHPGIFRPGTWLFTLLLFWLLPGLHAQQAELVEARNAMQALDYASAIRQYRTITDTYGPLAEATFNLATCYRLTGQRQEALYWYAQAVSLPNVPAEDLYHYAALLLQDNQCEQVRHWARRYLQIRPGDEQALRLLTSCDQTNRLLQKGNGLYEVQAVDFNSSYDEFGVTFGPEGLLFCSERPTGTDPAAINAWTDQPFLRLFQMPLQAGTCTPWPFELPTPLPTFLNELLNASTPTYCAATRELYFSANLPLGGKQAVGLDEEIPLGLFRTRYQLDGSWSAPEPLSINSPYFSLLHPMLSKDGQWLFFASDMPGGYGSLDLYVSRRQGADIWGPIRNLGPSINTRRVEGFPFLMENGYLAYASDGGAGLGGMDIYQVPFEEGVALGLPENPGYPLNSQQDDFAYMLEVAQNCGFLASNRPGGKGGDDVYRVRKIGVQYRGLVQDQASGQVLDKAYALLDCQPDTLQVDARGFLHLELPLRTCCQVTIYQEGYKPLQYTQCTHNLPVGAQYERSWELETAPPVLLQGVVFDQGTGLPVKGARLTLSSDCSTPGRYTPIMTELTGFYSFQLEGGCCYKVKASFPGYFAAIADNICISDRYGERTRKANLYLQPTVYDGTNLFQAEIAEKEAVYRDAITGLWLDQKTNQPADGTYPDGWGYDEGLIVQVGDTYSNRGHFFAPGRTRPDANEGIPFLLNIYYDVGRATFRPEAYRELEKLYQLLLENPDILIEIGAHTDARGSAEYNRRLSQERADAVALWLGQKGIAAERIRAVGYGERQLVNPCRDGVPCSEEAHQENRRTEFRVR